MTVRFVLRAFSALLASTFSMLPSYSHAADVHFAQIASMTNPASADNSKGINLGIKVYFEHMNAKGGVNGNRLVLTNLDDGLNAIKFVELANQVAADAKYVGLLGSLNSAGLAEITKQNLPANNRLALIAPLQGDKHVVGAANVFPLRSGYADELRTLLLEAKNWNKSSIAIVNMNVAFGPPFADLTNTLATDLGLKVVQRSALDTSSPEKLSASVAAAVDGLAKSAPKAVFMIAAGKPAAEFVKSVKSSSAASLQIYTVSVVSHLPLVEAAGKDKTRGIIISQATPYPFTPSKPAINEYQTLMRKYAPGEPLSFSSLEGFLGAKIATEAVRRTGGNPSRDKVLAALQNFGEYDLGGLYVQYKSDQRKGWGGVELTIINADGQLQK
ncbi:MAG: hypothetical protein RL758_2358 [Pseudomonadota bacterium]